MTDASSDAELIWTPTGRKLRISKLKPILYSMLENGIRCEFQCLEGHCGACEAELVEGDALEKPFGYEHARPRSSGRILLCTALPVSDRLLIKPSE